MTRAEEIEQIDQAEREMFRKLAQEHVPIEEATKQVSETFRKPYLDLVLRDFPKAA